MRESSTRSLCDMYDCQQRTVPGEEVFPTPYPQRKRVRRRRVFIDETQNRHIPVLSLQNYTRQEVSNTFYSRDEYMQMRDNIKHTIRFLKYRKIPPPSSNLNFSDANDLCIRGLECLADEYVNLHRKSTREMSMAAVFASQAMLLSSTTTSIGICNQEVIAETYKLHTLRAQSIAGRWGHFDALDAGITDDLTTDMQFL
ncbi:hypothetical protein IV203_012559 [Nitzschia inconspicua]|uniref:Uncharacterized protein n=1 Tax=Nitzschia inconspicua TaxID=303405 RepID=A0A9K3PJF0_9STRA|nr:hypothetical protein IV203_012559 [Nitzschia inconspicua]